MARSSRVSFPLLGLVAALSAGGPGVMNAHAQTTKAFTYQGQLLTDGTPATGSYDLRFTLFNAAIDGVAQTAAITVPSVDVTKGLFSVELNFPILPNDGRALFLQVEAAPAGTSDFVALSPRTRLAAAPYASGLALPISVSTPAFSAFSITSTSNGGTAIFGQCDTGSNAWGVAGFSSQGRAIYGSSSSGSGVYGSSSTGAGGFFSGSPSVYANWSGSGVGVFAGNLNPFGSSLIETNSSTTGVPHIFSAVNGTEVFSVRGSGDIYSRGLDFRLFGRGGGQGNNNANARAVVDGGWGANAVLGGGLILNFGNDFGRTVIDSTLTVSLPVTVNMPANFSGGLTVRAAVGNSSTAISCIATDLGFSTFNVSAAGSMQINGSAIKPGGGPWSAISDGRLKKDIRPLVSTLDRLLALRGVSFEFIDPAAIRETPGPHIGFVAQEVETVFPAWVDVSPETGYRSVAPKGFEALTVEALRDLRAEKDRQIAALKAEAAQRDAEAAAKQREIDDLKARLERLEARLK
ncbi:MAG: tail fiber domain-containing protein [Phycisphaerales bacterium]|nr:tail fiber domain-containing protein [Phycisphaerales bacterium]